MVYTLGESLLDIIINSNNEVKSIPGGAMLNTSVSLTRADVDVELISEIGNDVPAEIILRFLSQNIVGSYYIKKYPDTKSPVALAFLDKNKKPSYTFLKNYPEKRTLDNIPQFFPNDILLFGSFYSLDRAIRPHVVTILNKAKEAGITIIYDPNIRHASHLQSPEIRMAVIENIKYADIVKGSDEDFTNIFGIENPEAQIEEIRKINNNSVNIITLGAKGVICDFERQRINLPALETEIVSTIGAGDAFNAGIIYALSHLKIHKSRFGSYLKAILNSGLKFSAQVCNSMENYVPEK